MNILSIASILPIPNIVNENDVIFVFYEYYKKLMNDRIIFIRPTIYSNKLLATISKSWDTYYIINKLDKYEYKNFKIYTSPYLTKRSLNNMNAIFSNSIYYMNRKKIKKIIENYNINLVHAQYIFPDGLLAFYIWKKFNKPYVLTVRSEDKYFENFFSTFYAKKILDNAQFIIVLNYKLYKLLKKLGYRNLKLLPHGIGKNFLHENKKKINKRIKILSVCNLIKSKNIDKIILALSKLKEKNFIYTIIGNGPEKNNLLKLIKSYKMEDCIKFIDYIPHEKMPKEMVKHDIFILLSYPETFGRVYFEAMAVGLPIICAKDSGIYGYFKNKLEGIAVDYTNIMEIKTIIEQLIANESLRKKIGINGKRLVSKYTWDSIVFEINKIYKKIIN